MYSKRVITFISLALFLLVTVSNVYANPGLRNQSRIISKAISSQVKKAFIPRFVIQSRYAAPITRITFSKNSQKMATLNKLNTIHIWNLQNGQQINEIKSVQSKLINSIFFTDSGEFLVLVKNDKRLEILETSSGKTIYSKRFKNKISTINPIEKNNTLIISHSNGKNHILNITSKKIKLSALKTTQAIINAKILKNDLLAIKTTSQIIIADPIKGKIHSKLSFEKTAGSLTYNSKTNQLVWNIGKKLILWDLEQRKQKSQILTPLKKIKSLDFNPEGNQIVITGSKNSFYVWDLNLNKVSLFNKHEKIVNSAKYGVNGQFIFTGGDDRMVRVWDVNTKKEQIRLVSMNNGWAAVNLKGEFDGNLDGDDEDRIEAIKWVVEGENFALDGFLESYYNPGLFGKIMQQKKPIKLKQPAPAISKGFDLPPTLKFTKEKKKGANITFSVEVTGRNGGIEEFRLFQNGKRISNQKIIKTIKKNKGKKIIHSFTLPLVAGNNEFKAVALSTDKIESLPSILTVFHKVATKRKQQRGNLHLVVVGINKYKNSDLNLDFGVPDATGVQNKLTKSSVALFNKIVVHSLFDDRANTRSIKSTLSTLRKTKANDTVIIFFAGHGDSIGDNWYYVPYELVDPHLEDSLKNKGFSSITIKNLITEINAQKIMLLVDACKSGAVTSAFAEFKDYRSMAIMARRAGIHIGAASTKDQYAMELTSLGHGLFSYIIIEALKGNADTKPRNGKISTSEVMNYIKMNMPVMIKQYALQRQTPVLNSRGNDFNITINSNL